MSAAAPFFSIVMPVYNGEQYVEDAIMSVLQQSFGDFELIVSDDGSNDGSVALVQRLAAQDPRVQLLRTGTRSGPGANRNRALATARAAWIKFLDADDLWPADHLELCRQAIAQYPQAVLFFGDYQRFRESIADAEPIAQEGKRFFDPRADYVAEVGRTPTGVELYRMVPDRLLRFCCLFHCPISTQSVTLHGPTLRAQSIRFREDWVINEDFHVWMRLLESGPAVALRRVLFFYRLNPVSLTSNPVRYYEGMARSHGEWMHRIDSRLTPDERRIYRDKVAGFLHAVAWEQSRVGRIAAAAWAELRAAWVLRRPAHCLAVARTTGRALLWRLRAWRGRQAT